MNYAFRMKLKPGTWPSTGAARRDLAELAALLGDAGIYDYSIFLDEDTAPVCGAQAEGTRSACEPAGTPRDAALVGVHA